MGNIELCKSVTSAGNELDYNLADLVLRSAEIYIGFADADTQKRAAALRESYLASPKFKEGKTAVSEDADCKNFWHINPFGNVYISGVAGTQFPKLFSEYHIRTFEQEALMYTGKLLNDARRKDSSFYIWKILVCLSGEATAYGDWYVDMHDAVIELYNYKDTLDEDLVKLAITTIKENPQIPVDTLDKRLTMYLNKILLLNSLVLKTLDTFKRMFPTTNTTV